MYKDPILEEKHKVCEKLLKKHDNNVKAFYQEIRDFCRNNKEAKSTGRRNPKKAA